MIRKKDDVFPNPLFLSFPLPASTTLVPNLGESFPSTWKWKAENEKNESKLNIFLFANVAWRVGQLATDPQQTRNINDVNAIDFWRNKEGGTKGDFCHALFVPTNQFSPSKLS